MTTVVAHVIHHIDLTGNVIGIEVQPTGPAPTPEIAAAAFRAGLRTSPYLAGRTSDQYQLVRQIFVKQVVALVRSAAELVAMIDTAQPRRADPSQTAFIGGFRAAIEHLVQTDAHQQLRERITDVRPYLQAVAQQQLLIEELRSSAPLTSIAQPPAARREARP